MSHHQDETDFNQILAAIGERELTSWERERLWELLSADPDRIDHYTDHCFIDADLSSLAPEEAATESSKIVMLPGAEQAPRKLSPKAWRWIGAAAVLALGSALVSTIVLSPRGGEFDVAVTRDLKSDTATEAPPTLSMTSETAQIRRANLSTDDPSDEAVALSGAVALANSRSPRGGKPEGATQVPETISFNHHVRPILSENCFFCHGPDEATQEAGLRLDTFEGATADLGGYAAIVPGDAEASESWYRILSDDPIDVMPPPESHRELSEADREILRRWIEEGAVYDEHWAFVPPTRTEPPEASEPTWPVNPVDQFILAKLDQNGVEPNSPAAPRTIMRRLSLDLIGLPPSIKEYEAFETAFAEDEDAAVAEAADRLLASPHFGERMALAWLDAARYSDSNGFQQDGSRHQWPWRDWVVNAYNENMTFDQFTIEQIAGDLLENPTNDQLIATAFNRNHMLNGEGGAIKEEQRNNYVFDRVDATATTWLGLTMACAQCHTHKYDPITHHDYFSFFAFFNNLPESGGVDRRYKAVAHNGTGKSSIQISEPLLKLPTDEQTADIARLKKLLAEKQKELGEQLEAIQVAQHEWESQFTSQDFVDRKRFPDSVSTLFRIAPAERKKNQQITLAEFFMVKKDAHDNPEWLELGRAIAKTRTELTAVENAIIQVMVMRENPPEKTRMTHVFARGDYTQPTDEVPPGVPAFLPQPETEGPQTRLTLARWLVSDEQPLTARVTVNRIWQQFFGTGIVKTSEDFGVQAELPSHPELLDWLAVEFRDSGWDVKHIVRLIVTSQTYRQDSRQRPEVSGDDPENRLLARGARRRLPSMLLRDQALDVAGLLKADQGGLPVYPWQPEGLWEEFSFNKISYHHSEAPDQNFRRSLYTFWRRTTPPPNMFDSSTRQVCTVRSSTTNTPLQALVLMNDRTYLEAARALARRIVAEGGDDVNARLAYAFELATGRKPDGAERNVLARGFDTSFNEFASFASAAEDYVGGTDSENPVELAAYTRMAQVILNLDEVLNRP
ncbi:MAG: PSD1 and planctomycete cytochrome C domain-containing protein [Verrucomicrobiota bacterium]